MGTGIDPICHSDKNLPDVSNQFCKPLKDCIEQQHQQQMTDVDR